MAKQSFSKKKKKKPETGRKYLQITHPTKRVCKVFKNWTIKNIYTNRFKKQAKDWRLYQRKCIIGKQAHEKMLSNIFHSEKCKLKLHGIPLHTYLNG